MKTKKTHSLQELCVFFQYSGDNIREIVAYIFPLIFRNIFEEDRFAETDHDMGRPDPGKLLFKNKIRIADRDRDDRTAGALRGFEGTVVHHEELGAVLVPVAGSLREDKHGDALPDVVKGSSYGLHAFLGISPVQEKAVDPLHDERKDRYLEKIVFGDKSRKIRYMGISGDDIEHASVIGRVQDRFAFGDILVSEESHLHTAEKENDPETPLNVVQAPQVGFSFVKAPPEDPFDAEIGQRTQKEQSYIQNDYNKTKHRYTSANPFWLYMEDTGTPHIGMPAD